MARKLSRVFSEGGRKKKGGVNCGLEEKELIFHSAFLHVGAKAQLFYRLVLQYVEENLGGGLYRQAFMVVLRISLFAEEGEEFAGFFFANFVFLSHWVFSR